MAADRVFEVVTQSGEQQCELLYVGHDAQQPTLEPQAICRLLEKQDERNSTSVYAIRRLLEQRRKHESSCDRDFRAF